MPTTQSVLRDIQLLSKADQRKVHVGLSALLGATPAPQKTESEKVTESSKVGKYENLLYDNIAQLLSSKYQINLPPFKLFSNSNNHAQFSKVSLSLNEYLSSLITDRAIRLEERSMFYHLYAKLVTDDLEDIGAPVSVKSIVNGFERFPGLLDRAFPGYIRNGLFLKALGSRREA